MNLDGSLIRTKSSICCSPNPVEQQIGKLYQLIKDNLVQFYFEFTGLLIPIARIKGRKIVLRDCKSNVKKKAGLTDKFRGEKAIV